MLKDVKIWQNMVTPSLAVREDGTTIWLDNADPAYGGKPMFKMWHARTQAFAAFGSFANAEANIKRLDEDY